MAYEQDKGDIQAVVTRYIDAFSEGDYKKFRSVLADDGKFGKAGMSADEYTRVVQEGPQWRDVSLVKSVYSGDEAAILYDGTADGTKLQASEFLEVSRGKVRSVRGTVVELREAGTDFTTMDVMARHAMADAI